ncbi:hypothetical protein ACWDFH_07330 [Streptomyces kronopolitis]
MTTSPPSSKDPTHDPIFGAIRVTLDAEQGALTVSGEKIPTVALVRAEDADTSDHIPIGTRCARHLSLTLDSSPARIMPSRGRILRRSYRVDVEYAGVRYRLTPDSMGSSRLLKDGIAIGELSSPGDGEVLADWPEDSEILPQDAAVGYILAAAFGTGAQPFWMTAIEAASNMIP